MIDTWLRSDRLIELARNETGLADLGDPWFRGPFEQLLEFINRDLGPLPENDRRVQILVGNLSDRLRLADHLKRHPQLREQAFEVAGVIIVGRGGSTLLQRLLATSTQLTSMHYWELARPVPELDERVGDPSRRIAQGQARIDAMYETTPALKGMHPMDAMTYDEEIVLMERSFLSLMYASYFNLADYMPWLRTQDHAAAYRELELWLQVLTAQAPQRAERKWLLKSVHHLLSGGLRSLMQTFPRARMIMTHRNLTSVIASSCSAQAMLLDNFGNPVDPRALGPRWVSLYRDALEDMMAIRREQPERFIDLKYRDLTTDTLGQFRRVMEQLGLQVSTADGQRASDWLAANSRDKHPPHDYRLEDYGLSQAMIAETFKFYHDAYVA
jgi:hypothetical protein